jgi:excisionase family DNA binding protein
VSDKRWLTVPEAAEYVRVGRATLYEMVARGQVVHYRVGPKGGLVRFKASELDVYLESVKCGPKPKPTPQPAPTRDRYVSKYDHSKPGGPLRVPEPTPNKGR